MKIIQEDNQHEAPAILTNYSSQIPLHFLFTKRTICHDPLLTIVTRAYLKPNCRKICAISIDTQITQCFEHAMLEDTKGLGVVAADQALNYYKDRFLGKYIMILDDDDMFSTNAATTFISDIANTYKPEIIIWRGFFSEINSVYPKIDENWGITPVKGFIGSFNYCISKSLFDAHIHNYNYGVCRDFHFLQAACQEAKLEKIYWLKKILVRTQQKSYGKSGDSN